MYDFMSKYLARDLYPFHMPGHKGSRRFLPPDLLHMDFTEIPEADSLLEPAGVIRDLESRLSDVFGGDKSFLMTNGSTGCLLAALMAARRRGGEIIIARNCHKSVYSGLVLSGMKPLYIFPEMTDINIAGGLRPETVESALEKNPGAAAVVITSPTYEGYISDVENIAKIAHARGVPLIVDEAHGANLSLVPRLPDSAVKHGADIVVHSLHKQLPMLSQTAAIHVNKGLFDPAEVKKCINLIQTTSPSYIFMAQIDYALRLMQGDESIVCDYTALLEKFRNQCPREGAVRLFGEEYAGRFGIADFDASKILLWSDAYAGAELGHRLARDYGVQVEMSGHRHVLAMTSPADSPEGFDRLIGAVNDINMDKSAKHSAGKAPLPSLPIPKTILAPKDAFYAETQDTPLNDAVGMISGDFIIPYPPGIPLVVPGEVITREVLEYIDLCRKFEMRVFGAGKNIRTITLESLPEIL